MIGSHQAFNAATAVETLRALGELGMKLTDADVSMGIAEAKLPMRQELMCANPTVLIDGAHNLDKLTALAGTMREHLKSRRTVVVMGMLRDKQYEPSIRLVASLAHAFIACAPHSARALGSTEAARIAGEKCCDVRITDDVKAALAEAHEDAGRDGAVVVCGSFYLAGPAREEYLNSFSSQ
jgi:dihydrofolate synthase/folylpolyglutamate synthase